MTPRLITPADVETINAWMRARDMHPIPPDLLSSPTWIVDGVAATSLYPMRDVPAALIGNTIANPDTREADRDEALDALFRAAYDYAAAHGIRILYGVTAVPAIVKRAAKHGYRVKFSGATFLVAEVST